MRFASVEIIVAGEVQCRVFALIFRQAQLLLRELLCFGTKKEIERQDAIHRIAQNRENELRVLHAIERGPIERALSR